MRKEKAARKNSSGMNKYGTKLRPHQKMSDALYAIPTP
jgi:hypothetical protein